MMSDFRVGWGSMTNRNSDLSKNVGLEPSFINRYLTISCKVIMPHPRVGDCDQNIFVITILDKSIFAGKS